MRIKLLGDVSIRHNDGTLSPLMNSPKGVALLAYLIVNQQPQPREVVADLLWESSSTAQSLARLRDLLRRLRPLLPQLEVTRKMVAFRPNPADTIDLFTLQEELKSTAPITAYPAPLLDKFDLDGAFAFNDWLTIERERLHRQVIRAYRSLANQQAEQQAWQAAIHTAQRWIEIDPFDEQAYRHLMRHLAQAGRHDEVIQTFEHCRNVLHAELGVAPVKKTVELAAQLSQTQSAVQPGALPPQSLVPLRRNPLFTGRDAILEGVAGAFASATTVVLTGIGGIGKTQTAVEFCYRYGYRYTGGVFWFNFDSADDIAKQVAASGGTRGLALFSSADNLPLTEQVATVHRAWQAPLPRLLIFDNCEEIDLLHEWLPVTGGCRVLVTSRRSTWPTALGVETIALPLPSLAHCSQLVRQIAPRLDKQSAVAVAQAVGRLPLALQLAASFLHRYRSIPPQRYIQQLRNRSLQHPSLEGRGVLHSPTEHVTSVSRTFAISIDQLDPANQVDAIALQLLAHAAYFAPGEPIPLAILRDSVQSDELTAIDGLERLASLGLVTNEAGETIVMHRLVAAFVLQQVDERETVEQTVIAWVEAQRPHLPLPHLRHITHTAITNHSPHAIPLTIDLSRRLGQLGAYTEAEKLLQTALTATHAPILLGRLQLSLSLLHFNRGQLEQARQFAKRAATYLDGREAGKRWLVETLLRHGWCALRLSDSGDALAVAQRVVALADVPHTKAESLNLLGSIHYFMLGNYQAAEEAYLRGLAMLDDEPILESTLLVNLGECALTYGDYPRAETYFERGIARLAMQREDAREQYYRISLAEAQLHVGKVTQAHTTITAVLEGAPKEWVYGSIAQNVLAQVLLAQTKVDLATEAAYKALRLAESADDTYLTAQAWRLIGRCRAENWRSAFAHAERLFMQIENERELAKTWGAMSLACLATSDIANANKLCKQARELFIHLKLPMLLAELDSDVFLLASRSSLDPTKHSSI